LAKALPGHLTTIVTLAALELAAIGGTSTGLERKRCFVGAASRSPWHGIVRIPQSTNTGSFSRRRGGRAGELAEALSGHLTTIGTLAALELAVIGAT